MQASIVVLEHVIIKTLETIEEVQVSVRAVVIIEHVTLETLPVVMELYPKITVEEVVPNDPDQ